MERESSHSILWGRSEASFPGDCGSWVEEATSGWARNAVRLLWEEGCGRDTLLRFVHASIICQFLKRQEAQRLGE